MKYAFKCKNCGELDSARELQNIRQGQDVRPLDAEGEAVVLGKVYLELDWGSDEAFWDGLEVVGVDCSHCLTEAETFADLFEVVEG